MDNTINSNYQDMKIQNNMVKNSKTGLPDRPEDNDNPNVQKNQDNDNTQITALNQEKQPGNTAKLQTMSERVEGSNTDSSMQPDNDPLQPRGNKLDITV